MEQMLYFILILTIFNTVTLLNMHKKYTMAFMILAKKLDIIYNKEEEK